MAQQPPNIFQSREIIKRLLLTLGCLTAYIVGRGLPVPGLRPEALAAMLAGDGGTTLSSVSVFALGIHPYIAAAVLLSLVRWAGWIEALGGRDAEGRRVVYRTARALAAVFALGHAALVQYSARAVMASAGPAEGFEAVLGFVIPAATLAAGAMLVVWLAEEISENGIGNGVLLILFVDVAAAAPGAFSKLNALVKTEQTHVLAALGVSVAAILGLLGAVLIETAQRKTTVQFAKRVVGRMLVGGQQTAIPVRFNPGGAVALIAASTAVTWPAALAGTALHPVVRFPLFAALVIFFSWLYRRSDAEPKDVASRVQQQGGYVPGLRSGSDLTAHFSRLMDRLSMGSAPLVAAAALLPAIAASLAGMTISELSVYLVAAVALDTVAQTQARFMMQNLGGSIPQPGKMPRAGKQRRPSKRKKRRR